MAYRCQLVAHLGDLALVQRLRRHQYGRLADGDVSWRTQIAKAGDRYYVAGANLGILDGLKLTIVGR